MTTDIPQSRTVLGLFDTFESAQHTVQALIDNGFMADNVSLVAHDPQQRLVKQYGGTGESSEGTTIGATGGAVIGGVSGLLASIGTLTIPGIGPVLAAGSLATALGATALGAGLGAAAGGIVGALVGMGVSEEEAGSFAEGVRRGGTLVIVEAADGMVDRAYAILNEHGAIDMNERTGQWRQSGWTAYDPRLSPTEEQ